MTEPRMPELTDTHGEPTPWWFWLMAAAGVPVGVLAGFFALASLFGWSGAGAWTAALVAAAGGIAVVVAVGRHLCIDRFWIATGTLIACVATPGWAIAVVYGWFLIYCNEGCFS